MDRAELIASYAAVLKAIYEPKAYFERCLTLLRRLPSGSSVNRSFPGLAATLANVRALLRSLVRQGFSSYGAHYFSFLARVLRERARLFPKAVELAILGCNLFKTTAGYLSSAASSPAR